MSTSTISFTTATIFPANMSSHITRVTRHEFPIKVIHLDGDVLIFNRHTHEMFFALSKVLVLASPVFCAMFSLNGEGAALASTAKLLEIELPDGLADAMDVVLNILHFSNHNVDIYLEGYGGDGAERIGMNLPLGGGGSW